MNTTSIRRWTPVVGVALLMGSCGGELAAGRADKAGSETMVLRLATIDGEGPYGGPGADAFVEQLAELSGGRLKVEVTYAYGDGAPDAESSLIEAIAAGEVDGGWPSTRAFANAGIPGLAAIEAPMTLTSFDALRDLVTSPAADVAREQLDGSGITGLGLAVLDLRRPFAIDAPLLGPDDWDGVTFRSYHSPVQDDTIRALGGEPVDLSFSWVGEVEAGNLRGAESGVLGGTPPGGLPLFITGNVVLWPKVAVLSVNAERLEAMTDEQRGWVTDAADLAVQASVDGTYDEDGGAQSMCEQGARVVPASAEQLDALHEAVAPVIDALAADPATAPLMAEVQAVAERNPDPDVLDVPDACQQLDRPEPEALAIPTETSTLPDGIYRVEVTLADVEAAGLNNSPGYTGTWSLTVENGIYHMTCTALDRPGRDCGNVEGGFEGPFEAGHLKGDGDRAFFVFDIELMAEMTPCALPGSDDGDWPCYELEPVALTWALDGDELTFSDPSGPVDPIYFVKPWTKIG